jgi:hypothetical protein
MGTFLLKNQNVATLAGQFTIKGCPIDINIEPINTKKYPLLIKVKKNIPIAQSPDPTRKLNLSPLESIIKFAGKLLIE